MQPFIVYYNKVVTQVLGTSFTIKTNSKTKNIEVSVKTGKVQVYENMQFLSAKDKGKGVIVSQNQKAIYNREQRVFETTLSDLLQPLSIETDTLVGLPDVEFQYKIPTSIQSICQQFERIYGVEIIVESENIYNCLFNGDLSKKDLYKKLEILCLTVDAEFEIRGTKILISGKGCD